MSYTCKDCNHNNNGWCNELKKQGLKQINYCEFKATKNKEVNVNNKLNIAKTFSQRELLYYFIKTVLNKEAKGFSEISLEELKQAIVAYSYKLDLEESFIGDVIEYEYEIDKDIVDAVKSITNKWR